MLGYVPAVPMTLVDETPALETEPVVPTLPPHREAARAFRFAGAARDDLCFWYREDEDTYCYAVGKDDWAPLAVVGFSLVANRACEDALNSGIASSLWLNSRDDVLRSWRHANAVALHSLGQRPANDAGAVHALNQSSDLEREVIPSVDGAEMASLFATTWRRRYVDSPVFFLANSQAYALLHSHQAIKSSANAAAHALECVFEWLAVWLESRGVDVDRENWLVHLPGYQALFYRADQGI